jgi:mono/diheme cytochrome c family protein
MRIIAIITVLFMSVPTFAGAQTISRGRYIVEHVGLCGDCHTPRDQTGMPVAERKLTGAPIGFRPLHPMPFAEHAPPLAGIPAHFTPTQLATFLQTGRRPDGSAPLPPMPPYRLSKDDAWAVVDYLKSLK